MPFSGFQCDTISFAIRWKLDKARPFIPFFSVPPRFQETYLRSIFDLLTLDVLDIDAADSGAIILRRAMQ